MVLACDEPPIHLQGSDCDVAGIFICKESLASLLRDIWYYYPRVPFPRGLVAIRGIIWCELLARYILLPTVIEIEIALIIEVSKWEVIRL